jgi:predicted Zn-dependent protease
LAPVSKRASCIFGLAALGSSWIAWRSSASALSRSRRPAAAVPSAGALKGDLIRAESQIGGLQAGLAKARELAKNDPENGIYDLVSAELYEKAGRKGEAVDLLEKAVAARPSDDTLIATLSALYGRNGDPAKAEGVLNARHHGIYPRYLGASRRAGRAQQSSLALSAEGRSEESARIGRAGKRRRPAYAADRRHARVDSAGPR